MRENGHPYHGMQSGVRDPFAPPQRARAAVTPGQANLDVAGGSSAPVTLPQPAPQVQPRAGSLVVVGAGIMAVNQMTIEARGWIEAADKVLSSGVDPITERWIAGLNEKAETVSDTEAAPCALNYVREGLIVCAVHGGDARVWLEVARICRIESRRATLVPGVSTEDCLFSDLGIDPLQDGVQIYDATDYLVHGRERITSAGLVLRRMGQAKNARGFCDSALARDLKASYGAEHEAVLYEPARYSVFDPTVRRCTIGQLGGLAVTAQTSLYVPPHEQRFVR